jgi:hypothetical protein
LTDLAKKSNGGNDVNNVFYLSEIERLNTKVNYLERTLYNKARKKVNAFLKKSKARSSYFLPFLFLKYILML